MNIAIPWENVQGGENSMHGMNDNMTKYHILSSQNVDQYFHEKFVDHIFLKEMTNIV